MRSKDPRQSPARSGFTLIELLVVLAIIATLLAIVAPRYFRTVDRSKEVALKQSLAIMRDAIDKFSGDQGVHPETLEVLVEKRYLRAIPVDPITESATTWQIVGPPEPPPAKSGSDAAKGLSDAAKQLLVQQSAGKVYDVKSGADGTASDGSSYQDW
ncbi:MAG: type II secretion system protein [Burkholderiales bacterium]